MKDLITKADMAKRWGVSRQVVHNWSKRHEDFPQPVDRIGMTPVFSIADVERYEKMRIRTMNNQTEAVEPQQ
jgi:predicted DNA-binding transcriptional regulator AlpA